MKSTLFICVVILLAACRGNKNKHEFSSEKERKFYTDHQGMDYIRFPLIMPYDVMCIDMVEKNWIVDLKIGNEFYYSIDKVKEIAIIDSIILVYSTSIQQVISDQKPKQWFVVIPSKKIEIGFSNEVEFKEYIKQYGITDIKWVETNTAYKKFKDTGCLPWIPGCSE